MQSLNSVVSSVTQRVIRRSASLRSDYLQQLASDQNNRPERGKLSCGNLAHGFAACGSGDKDSLRLVQAANMAIVTAYNDMLSAHQPYADYPDKIKCALREMGCTGQVAGGVPAMCDGVTQGQDGMELSLLSRDLIAQCTALSLSHQMFDGVLALGICDKIVPGLLMGALSFGYLPVIFVPAGPMESGLPNAEKQRIRQLFAEGKVDRERLLQAESESYHSHGTCTFYGTANSNQVVLEALGLQLPGSSFVNPDNPLREALTAGAAHQLARITALGNDYRPIGKVVDERSIINASVALLSSGGSTNHSMHIVAIARAAGIFTQLVRSCRTIVGSAIDGQGLSERSSGRQPLSRGRRHQLPVPDAAGRRLYAPPMQVPSGGTHLALFINEPFLDNGRLEWRQSPREIPR